MTLAQALTVRDGDYVTSKYVNRPGQPLRVTQVWVNARQTIVQFRIHALGGTGWVDSSAVELPPKVQKVPA